jgi:hypothetical protein
MDPAIKKKRLEHGGRIPLSHATRNSRAAIEHRARGADFPFPLHQKNSGPLSGMSQATVNLVREPARGTPATTQSIQIVVPVAAILPEI